jgi:hypothetical protein
MGTRGSFPARQSGRNVKLTTRLHLLSRSKNEWNHTSTHTIRRHGVMLSLKRKAHGDVLDGKNVVALATLRFGRPLRVCLFSGLWEYVIISRIVSAHSLDRVHREKEVLTVTLYTLWVSETKDDRCLLARHAPALKIWKFAECIIQEHCRFDQNGHTTLCGSVLWVV